MGRSSSLLRTLQHFNHCFNRGFLLGKKNGYQRFYKAAQVAGSPSGHCHSTASAGRPLGRRALRQISTAPVEKGRRQTLLSRPKAGLSLPQHFLHHLTVPWSEKAVPM